MAFPVPEHLPRKQLPTDVSSQILSRISDATNKSLNAELAAEWVAELQLNIRQTKDRIYDRINEKLPDFERQFESSNSVQTRLKDLSLNVDKLTATVENPETGILPTLLEFLEAHKRLQQRASDARVTFEAISYLSECRSRFESLTALVHDGSLAEGVRQRNELSSFLNRAPEALANADVMADMKNQLRTLRDWIDEQLSAAYYRSIRISSTELRISPSVQVRRSQAIISLPDILESLSTMSLDSYLRSLRRDIVAHFIDFPSQQATSSTVSRNTDADGTPHVCFSLFPLPPSAGFKRSIPAYFKSLFDFLREHLISALPPLIRDSFPRILYKPTANALLSNVLVSSLPSSLSELPQFLELIQDAVKFEQEYFFREDSAFDGLQGEGEIRTWGRGVAGHYGRKRRIDLLAETRKLILTSTNGEIIRVEVTESSLSNGNLPAPEVIPVQGGIEGREEVGWDFDDDVPAAEADVPEIDNPAEEITKQEERDTSGRDFGDADAGASDQTKVEDDGLDDSDAWGWGDDEETSTPATSENGNAGKPSPASNGRQVDEPQREECARDTAWDTTWDEPEPIPPSPPSPAQPISSAKAPKVAKGLEKLSAKGKTRGLASPALSSNPPSSTFSATSRFPSSISSITQPLDSPSPRSSSSTTFQSPQPKPSHPSVTPPKPPALSLPEKPKQPETYLISSRITDVIRLISNMLSEGRALSKSSVFSDFPLSSPDSTSNASTLVLQSAPAALDLYRAVYPVVFAMELSRSARALRFSNDCLYMHEEITKLVELEFRNGAVLAGSAASVHEQMNEALERLHALGAWWFDEGIERECERVKQILSRAEGFVELSQQDRFDECEAVMSEILRGVRAATGEWKSILPRTKWLRAAGRVVETALARVLSDVLALPDIPELDSRRLSELCRILNALEGLFVDVENPEAPSMVLDYVPSWLKYSYLSELLEASIADISYLFDEGALIDFSVDELVSLVRALFADTPLRANTIAKLQLGHPVSVG
ncbi:YTM1_1 [Sanghuangporus sanghuang]